VTRSNTGLLPFLFTAFLFAPPSCAQKTDQEPEDRSLKGLSLEQLGNVEVTTASKAPVKVSRTPAAIYVISQDDIRRSGVASLPEALRLAPGVEVARIDSVKWAVGIRGFETRLSRAVLVLIDGRTVYSPLFHGVYWEVQDTLLEDIDRIEVIRGPGGTIWGANAVDGVINIITRSSKDTHGTLVSAGGGNTDQGFLDLRQGGNTGNFNYRVYAKGLTHGSEFHPDNRQFDDWRKTQAGFRTDWDPTSHDSLTVQGDLYDEEAGQSIRITYLSPPSASNVQTNVDLSGGNLLARWRRTMDDSSGFELQTYYDRVNRAGPSQSEYRDTFDLDFVHHFAWRGGQNITWGLGARISLGRVPTVIPTFVFSPTERTDQVYSLYAQDEIPLLGDRLSLTLGSKFLHSAFVGWDTEPSLRVLWTPTSRRTIWAAVTRAVRTPSDNDDDLTQTSLISTSPPAFSRTSGNGKFNSETLIGYEAGYRSLIRESFSLDLAAFFNQYDHLASIEPETPFIEASPSPPHVITPFVNGNGLKGTTYGFELASDWKPAPWWHLKASYSFLHMDLTTRRDSLDTTSVTSSEGSSPQHQPAIQSYFDVRRNMEFSLAWRYVSRLPAIRVPGYETGDARFAWHPAQRLELSVTGQNLLQPHHAEYNGDPGPLVGIKRTVYAAITWRN
jgi:iron complex outermembrane receptor protein